MDKSKSKKDLLAEEWFKKATDDELTVKSVLKHRDGAPNSVCFMSHQMAEKYLKGYLVLTRKWYPKIHTLDKLTALCMKIDPTFKELKEIVTFLDPFYTPARYPSNGPDFSWDDAEKAYNAAEGIKEFVLEKIK